MGFPDAPNGFRMQYFLGDAPDISREIGGAPGEFPGKRLRPASNFSGHVGECVPQRSRRARRSTSRRLCEVISMGRSVSVLFTESCPTPGRIIKPIRGRAKLFFVSAQSFLHVRILGTFAVFPFRPNRVCLMAPEFPTRPNSLYRAWKDCLPPAKNPTGFLLP